MQLNYFENLAGKGNCNFQIKKELLAANITVIRNPCMVEGEVVTNVVGEVKGFAIFERRWRYYNVDLRGGLPLKYAEKINAKFKDTVRIDGHANGKDISDLRGLCPIKYHIDTQEGLNYFVEVLSMVQL